MKKPKVLLIQEVAMSYREPIYELMNEEIDLTIGYIVSNQLNSPRIKTIKLPSFNVGKLIFPIKTYSILNQYDVVILLPHLKYFWLSRIAFLPRKFKLITWSIGVHVSYDRHYDLTQKPSLKDWVFEYIQDQADACIFYMPEPIEYWKKYKKIDELKYFVAHNTVKVEDFLEVPKYADKNTYLFVGTLYRQKGLDELLEAYALAKQQMPSLPVLNIIGKGPEENDIKTLIKTLGLMDSVFLRGAIYEEKILKEYFFKAKLCISPKQAGLSVLKSLGYGVPFVTRPNAITGGEINNIVNGENGLFYNSIEELANILIDSDEQSQRFELMSSNARSYYINNCQPTIMAKGALDAIRYVWG